MKPIDESKFDKILIHTAKTIELVSVEALIRIEAMQNYAKVFVHDSKVMVSTKNLKFYKDLLKNHSFFQCHKSHFINVRKILRYHKEGTVEMQDGSAVPISRRQRDPFLERLKGLIDGDTDDERVLASYDKMVKMAL